MNFPKILVQKIGFNFIYIVKIASFVAKATTVKLKKYRILPYNKPHTSDGPCSIFKNLPALFKLKQLPIFLLVEFAG